MLSPPKAACDGGAAGAKTPREQNILTQHTQSQASESDAHGVAPLEVIRVDAGQHAQAWGQREPEMLTELTQALWRRAGAEAGCSSMQGAQTFTCH